MQLRDPLQVALHLVRRDRARRGEQALCYAPSSLCCAPVRSEPSLAHCAASSAASHSRARPAGRTPRRSPGRKARLRSATHRRPRRPTIAGSLQRARTRPVLRSPEPIGHGATARIAATTPQFFEAAAWSVLRASDDSRPSYRCARCRHDNGRRRTSRGKLGVDQHRGCATCGRRLRHGVVEDGQALVGTAARSPREEALIARQLAVFGQVDEAVDACAEQILQRAIASARVIDARILARQQAPGLRPSSCSELAGRCSPCGRVSFSLGRDDRGTRAGIPIERSTDPPSPFKSGGRW